MSLAGKEERPILTDLSPTLSRRASGSAWRTLGIRAAIAGLLLLIAFTLLWLDRDGLQDQIDGHLSFAEVIYFTMITITTVGYGDIVPVTERARLIDAFLITPIRLFLWLIFLGTAFDMLFKRSWERLRMRRIQKKLNDHIVIAGFGRHGETAAGELIAQGVDPSRLVVIDCKDEPCAAARELGAAVLQGDASSDALLKAVHIERAARMIISAGRDDTSILIVLTARALAPKLPIAVTISTLDNEDIAEHAGASHVINPIMVAGRLLAQATQTALAPA